MKRYKQQGDGMTTTKQRGAICGYDKCRKPFTATGRGQYCSNTCKTRASQARQQHEQERAQRRGISRIGNPDDIRREYGKLAKEGNAQARGALARLEAGWRKAAQQQQQETNE